MNIKELVQRWRNALMQREMFYYPVKKVDNVKYSVTATIKIPYLTVEDKYDIENLSIYDRTGTLLGVGSAELPNGTYYAVHTSTRNGCILSKKKIKFKVNNAPVNIYVIGERVMVTVTFHLTPCEFIRKEYTYEIKSYDKNDFGKFDSSVVCTYDLLNSDFYNDYFSSKTISLENFDNSTKYYVKNPKSWKRRYNAITEFNNDFSNQSDEAYVQLNSQQYDTSHDGYKITFDIIGDNIDYNSSDITINKIISRKRHANSASGNSVLSKGVLDGVTWYIEDGWYRTSDFSDYTDETINDVWSFRYDYADNYSGLAVQTVFQDYYSLGDIPMTNILKSSLYDQSFSYEETVMCLQNNTTISYPFAEYTWSQFWEEEMPIGEEHQECTYTGDKPPSSFSYICLYTISDRYHQYGEDKKVISYSNDYVSYLCGVHSAAIQKDKSLTDDDIIKILKSEEYITPIYVEN